MMGYLNLKRFKTGEKLKIKTTRFGTVDIKEEKIITMPFGMLGFPDKKRYFILQHQENSPFFWYQSADDPVLAFVITNPFLFIPKYKIDLKTTLKEMSWNGNGNDKYLDLFIVVNIPKGRPHKMTGNFIGPILVNSKTYQAVQIVLSNSPYTHKFPLFKKKK
jgi:flagellar assembly factor FliW